MQIASYGAALFCFLLAGKESVQAIRNPRFEVVIVPVSLFLAGVAWALSVVFARWGYPHQGVRLLAYMILFVRIPTILIFRLILMTQRSPTLAETVGAVLLLSSHASFGIMHLRYQHLWIPVMNSISLQCYGLAVLYCAVDIGAAIICCFFGTTAITLTTVTHIRRRLALRRAKLAMTPYAQAYSQAWSSVIEGQEGAAQSLTKCVQARQGRKQLQPSADIDHLLRLAMVLQEWFQEVAKAWADLVGVEHEPAPLKSKPRIMEKVLRSYKGQANRVLDLVRSTIVVSEIAEAEKVVELVARDATVHVIKNRFDPGYDATETFGYRDINLQLTFPELHGTLGEGFVFELQVHLAAFHIIKSADGHNSYIMCRNLSGN